MPTTVSRQDADQMAADLAVLAEPHRLLVINELRDGPRSAGDLAKATSMAPSLASHHLSVLLRADLVTRWREGSFVYYTLNRARMSAVQKGLAELSRAPASRSSRSRP